jgi:hypothetical protein
MRAAEHLQLSFGLGIELLLQGSLLLEQLQVNTLADVSTGFGQELEQRAGARQLASS